MPNKLTLKLKTDTSVIQPLYDKLDARISKLNPELSKRVSEAFELLLDSGDLLFEITTVECDLGATGAKQLLVTFYPTDCFLMFARAVLTGDFDSLIVKD